MAAGERTVEGGFTMDVDQPLRANLALRTSLKQTNTTLEELGRTTETVGAKMTASWKTTADGFDHEADRMTKRMDRLSVRMDEFARKKVTAQVNLDGVAAANAEIELLMANLGRLSRTRATPRVAMGGGAASAVSSAGGGAANAGRRGFDRGFGGGGPFGVPWWAIGGGAALAAPLLGTAGALGASAGSGLLGAGALGLAGGATGIAGAAATFTVLKPAITDLKTLKQSQDAYNKAVIQYGAASKQATTAKQKMDAEFAHSPGAGKLLTELQKLSSEYTRLTRPGRRDLLAGGTTALAGIRRGVGGRTGFAASANRITGAVGTQTGQLGQFLGGGETRFTVDQLSREFSKDLPYVERSLENISRTMEHITVAALPFFHEGIVWGEKWTKTWDTSTSDMGKTTHTIDGLVTSTKDWVHLGGSAVRLVKDLFAPAVGSGDSAVVSLTHTLDRWDDWAQRNPQKLQTFFRQSVQTVSEIAKEVGLLAKSLFQVSALLSPIVEQFAKLSQIGGGLGLLLPLGASYARYRMWGGGGGGGGRGGGGGFLPFFGGGGGGGRGGMGGAGAALAGGYAASRFMGTSTPAFQRAYGGVAGARFGGPVSQLGMRGRAGVIAGIPGRARAIGGGALRFGGPLVLTSAALGGATTQGGLGERLEGALSSATFGAVGPPVTGAGHQRAGQEAAARFAGQIGGHTLDRQERQLQQFIAHEQAQLPGSQTKGALARDFGTPATGPDRRRLRAEIAALRDEQKQVRTALDQESRTTAEKVSSSFGTAFNRELKKKGPAKAMHDTTKDILTSMGDMRPAGQRVLAQNALTWARQMAQDNPKLKGQYHALVGDVTQQFDQLGQHIKIINGQIYTGSKSEWQSISAAITGPAARAREKVIGDLQAIQTQAVNSLVAAGFPRNQARSIVRGIGAGTTTQQQVQTLTTATQTPGGTGGLKGSGLPGTGKANARGGVVEGRGMLDTVAMGNSRVAPGEVLVANRHTENRINRMMGGKSTLRTEIGREDRAHWYPGPEGFARGGVAGGAYDAGLTVGVGTFGVSNPAGTGGADRSAARRTSSSTSAASGGGATGPMGLSTGGTAQTISLKAPTTGAGGYAGALGDRILSNATRGIEARINTKLGQMAPAGGGGTWTGGPLPGGTGIFDGMPVAKWIIPELQYARAHGWTGHITSGFRSHAHNVAQGRYYHSMHEDTTYPGGAVDFGGPGDAANRIAFQHATTGYTGPRLIAGLPNDLGHMSGTGHARGGIMRYARGGGMRVGAALSGAASTYGNDPTTGYHDAGDNNIPALAGASNNRPGIAVYNRSTLGGYWDLTAPNNISSTIQQTDLGPAPGTGATFDVNAVAARTIYHYPQGNRFPTKQGTWHGTYRGKNATPTSGTRAGGAAVAKPGWQRLAGGTVYGLPSWHGGFTVDRGTAKPTKAKVKAGGAKTLSQYDKGTLRQLAQAHGFPNPNLAAAIAMAESSGNPRAHSATDDWGLWQINRPSHPEYFKEQGKILDPNYNATAAYDISDHGQHWGPWSTYNSGAYRKYMTRGGQLAWGGAHAQGGAFSVRRPTMFIAGERGEREDVVVRRAGQGGGGGGGHTIHVGVTINGNVTSQEHANAMLEKAAERAADKLLEALDGEADRELVS